MESEKAKATVAMQSSSANLNTKEPWTGRWKVEGIKNRIWDLKQTGGIVKSTEKSGLNIKGRVAGNQLKGRIVHYGQIVPLSLKISSDKRSFEGYLIYPN